MVWTPKFDFIPTAPFSNAFKAKVEAVQTEALAWAATQCGIEDTLPDFEGIHFNRALRDSYPRLNLIVIGGDPAATEGGDYDESKLLLLEAEDISSDADDLFGKLEAYVLALRSIATEMTEREWTVGLSTDSRDSILVTVGSERVRRARVRRRKFVRSSRKRRGDHKLQGS